MLTELLVAVQLLPSVTATLYVAEVVGAAVVLLLPVLLTTPLPVHA